MKKFYVYDKDGCGYVDSILFTTKPINNRLFTLIGVYNNAYDANLAASKYIYDVQKLIDLRYDRDYYEGGDAYPNFSERDYINFIYDDYEYEYNDEDDDEEW